MNNKLNDKQIAVIRELYENSDEFRNTVAQHVNKRVSEAQKLSKLFGDVSAPDAPAPEKPKQRKRRKSSKKGQSNHPSAILGALGSKSMTRSEIATALSKKGHDIDEKTLNTTLYNMKKNAAKGKDGLEAQGDRGSMKYTAAVKS